MTNKRYSDWDIAEQAATANDPFLSRFGSMVDLKRIARDAYICGYVDGLRKARPAREPDPPLGMEAHQAEQIAQRLAPETAAESARSVWKQPEQGSTGALCSNCGKKYCDHIAITDGGQHNVCPHGPL